MKGKAFFAGAAALAMLVMCSGQAAAENPLLFNVVCPEGYFVDGSVVADGEIRDSGTLFVRAANDVMIDWSDDIVYHQWSAGSKVRVEVILTEPATGAYVYTLAAHFMIEKQDADGTWDVIYDPRSIGEDLWIEGPESRDAYKAEINSEGRLLYGFNWDTRTLSSGDYRLSFWIGEVPSEDPDGNPITPLGVDITAGAPGDTKAESGVILAEVEYFNDFQLSTLTLELLSKEHGRGVNGK
ncbi:MAG: hypothetical protein OEM29_04250 [Thermoplasmata archaeon]|nr:hypothetical protein [Thermoplasmata archaeon]